MDGFLRAKDRKECVLVALPDLSAVFATVSQSHLPSSATACTAYRSQQLCLGLHPIYRVHGTQTVHINGSASPVHELEFGVP